LTLNLQQQVRAAFDPASALARAAQHFRPRQGQLDMALAVAGVIEEGGALVVEASTGVGKTFSYLVPALLSGERVLLSTATKTLQDQLYGRDLPLLIDALGLPASSALLKGRASYLCLHRLQQARFLDSGRDRAALKLITRIETWAQATQTGDLAELPGLDERSAVLPLVTSTRENCLGSACPSFKACHVVHARKQAMAADVVVVNHHLFFADMAVRESGIAELLPTVRVVIFDEAHQLNETGVQFLGKSLGTAQVLDLVRDLLAAGLQLARGLVDWHGLASGLEHAARELRLLIGKAPSGRLVWQSGAPQGLDEQQWAAALADLQRACQAAAEQLDTVSELAPDFVRLRERALLYGTQLTHFAGQGEPERVRWVEVGQQARLVESPLDIAQEVGTRLLGQQGRSWVFTSATLGDDEQLSWFTEPCGLQQARVLRIGSPFDYARQAALYVPSDLPEPADPRHTDEVAARVAQWALKLGGRTLVLTTSLKALRRIAQLLQDSLGPEADLDVLAQGQGTKRELMERFRLGDRGRGCVLVASASFWEGIDVAGDALQLVVIDKLPFPSPGDPLTQARARQIEARGASAFTQYFLPEAAVSLKQGAGRLIRRESDRGALVVCDTRLLDKGYGRRLLQALPPMQRLQSHEQFEQWLEGLTRAATTASSG
jgi:ATP-dependent DNA helicase DinG